MTRAIAVLSVAAIVAWIVARADNYQLFVFALVGLTAIVATGLNILVGLSGQISLGHAAFYAIGAYGVGILTTRYGLDFWLAWPIGAGFAALASIALAVPAIRVRGPYLAMVTIAFGLVVEQAIAEWKDVTGGWNGLLGIETPRLFGHSFGERDVALLVLTLTIAVTVGYHRFAGSAWGQAMRAVRDSESAARSIALDPVLLRSVAFGLSALLAGLAGGIFAAMSNFISPESFPFLQSILFLLVVMVGGTERVMGPLVGAIVLVLLPELLSWLAQYRLLFVGLLLFIVLRLAPHGIVGLVERLLPKRTQVEQRPDPADVTSLLTRPGGDALSIEDLSIAFGGIKAVSNLSFTAEPGRITSLIGPNGAGKTTALNMICGYYRADGGRVRLGKVDLTAAAAQVVARAGIARTYQTTQLFSSLSVLDNVAIALRAGRLGIGDALLRDTSTGVAAEAAGLLAFVGYMGNPHVEAGALPHVDKRLVEIARALAIRPAFLVLDEPAAGLGPEDTKKLEALLVRIAGLGIGVLLVEHDMSLVMSASSHIVVLDAGRKIAEGNPSVIARNSDVRAAYLGDGHEGDRKRGALLPASQPLLSISDLTVGYGPIGVLESVSLEVRQGEAVAILGPNGAGKTTLMRALTGLLKPTSGRIIFDDKDVTGLTSSRIAAAGLVLVPEGRQVFPELSVIDNLRLGAFARPSDDTEQRVADLLTRFPRLAERSRQRAGLLSGGEQQMLAIARGLMARPRILLLDEPSLGLAPRLVDQLYDTLASLRDERMTLLLVDQMASMALSVADRAYVLGFGRVVTHGSAAAIAEDKELTRTYLGEQAGT